jgi:dTDP-4-amino-4,6-dideoxygalactose transaminase
MMDLQAALGIHQLARVEQNWQRRRELWQRYDEGLAGLPVTLPSVPEADTRHGYHLYTLLVDPARSGMHRDEFLEAMNAARIGTGVHYLSVPEHPYYQERFGWRPEQWPHAMRLGRQTVSLPLSPAMSDEDAGRVINTVRGLLGG